MLTGIGPRREGDLVELMLECHTRIRSFVALARAAGERTEIDAAERGDACARVERYFTEALPLHVLDEEESVLPRLRGASAEVDRALAAMHEQHDHHGAGLLALLDACAAVRGAPDDPERRATLAAAAIALAREFDEHLELEERVIFPAIRETLSADVQAQITRELRARRTR